jgi:hypothetical protein
LDPVRISSSNSDLRVSKGTASFGGGIGGKMIKRLRKMISGNSFLNPFNLPPGS